MTKNRRNLVQNTRLATNRSRQFESLESRQMMSSTPWEPDVPGPQPRIINGTPTSAYAAVGIVNDGCTGTLISPTHVLTAAHCTEGVGDRQGSFQVNGRSYSTTDITDHPQYNSNRFDAGYDISIMELSQAVNGVSPMPIYRQTPRVGQVLTLVGFGEGGNGNSGGQGDFGNKRVGTTPIDEVTSLHISWNFDNNNESNTAPGDSGGPAFLTLSGQQYIAGITSGGSNDDASIGDYSFDTRVDVFASWIDAVVGQMPPAPNPNPAPNPIPNPQPNPTPASPDDHGDSIATATAISLRNGSSVAQGVLE
ncbi:MAG: trypsin-like serine protease, partial [Planctomycetales bacterium]|nr:trypsin-like serine protease [Planctomycetales bacterium]